MYYQSPPHNPVPDENVCLLVADKDGIVISIHNMVDEEFGCNREEVIGQSFSMLFHPEMVNTIEELLVTLLCGKTWEGYLKRLNKAGDSFWVRLAITPIGEDGSFLSKCYRVLDDAAGV